MATIQPTAHVFWNCGWERVDVADRYDGLFPLEATAAGCNLKKPWGGALNLQPLQCLRIRKAKRWFEAICFSAVTPSPSAPQHAKHILFNPRAKF